MNEHQFAATRKIGNDVRQRGLPDCNNNDVAQPRTSAYLVGIEAKSPRAVMPVRYSDSSVIVKQSQALTGESGRLARANSEVSKNCHRARMRCKVDLWIPALAVAPRQT